MIFTYIFDARNSCQIKVKEMEIVMVERFEDYSPEDIAEEFEESPFEPRYAMCATA